MSALKTILSFALIFGAFPALASGSVRQEIDELYFHRDQAGNLDKSIDSLEALIKGGSAQTPMPTPWKGAEPDLYWRLCRSLVRRGEKREKKADKLADYDLARADCEKSVNLGPDDAEGHFWYGVAMGRWGEAKGILKALFLIKPIRKEMAATLKLDPKHGGAHRVLGEMLWQIPGFAGGDKKAALAEYETSVKLSPEHSTSYIALADAYVYFDRKDDAIKTLNAVVEMKNPDDPAEYVGDLADAKKLLAKLTAK